MVREWVKQSKHLVVLTGAGISAESGVPTFRGSDGLWRKFRAEELATPEAFARDPKLVWEWYDWRRGKVAQTQPNLGHLALVKLEQSSPNFSLITQNVDGLHDLAGSGRPLKLHGDIWEMRCTSCSYTEVNRDVPLSQIPPKCECGALLRPAIVSQPTYWSRRGSIRNRQICFWWLAPRPWFILRPLYRWWLKGQTPM